MKVSEKGIELIKSVTECHLTSKPNHRGILTLGYSHTGDVKEGQKITQKKAEKLLLEDLEKIETQINTYYCTKYTFTQNEFDALMSIAFSGGDLNQLTKGCRLNKGAIADSIKSFLFIDGKPCYELAKQRKTEYKLFISPV